MFTNLANELGHHFASLGLSKDVKTPHPPTVPKVHNDETSKSRKLGRSFVPVVSQIQNLIPKPIVSL
jgi:hypothetical protein